MESTNKTRRGQLHFANSSYPTFGRGKYNYEKPPKTVTDSPYYWWFKFLQLNEDYRATEANKGVGPCADLYKDFGDVSNIDFKEWWRTHAPLFAEPPTDYDMVIVKTATDLVPLDSKKAINLVVPLDWSSKGLKKRFSQIIDKLVKEKVIEASARGVNIQGSKSDYRIGRRWNASALESAYLVYTIRKQNMDKGATLTKKAQFVGDESNKFQLAWADVAIRANLKVADGLDEKVIKHTTAEKRKLLTILANRHYKRAIEFIAASVTREFPSSLTQSKDSSVP